MVLNSDDSLSSCLTSIPNRHHTPSPPSFWYDCLLILMWYVWKYPGFKEMHSITPTCLPSGFAAVILSLLPKHTDLEMCYTWFWVSQYYFWLGKDSSLYIFYERSDAARITEWFSLRQKPFNDTKSMSVHVRQQTPYIKQFEDKLLKL